jgi:hypothetical protein
MPKKQSQLTAATSVTDADEMNIAQAGTSKRVPLGIVQTQLPINYIGGLITSNNGVDPDADVDIAVGEARDSTNVDNMRLTAAITKQLDTIWAVGDDQGGLDTGSIAPSTLYAIWLIKRSDTGVVDALFSTSFTAPSMPTNYDRKRLIGAVKTDGSSDILLYTQIGDYFRYDTDIIDVNDGTITSLTPETAALSVPPSSIAHIYGHLKNPTETNSSGFLAIRTSGATDTSPLTAFAAVDYDTEPFRQIGCVGQVLVDSSSQVDYEASEGAGVATVQIITLGFTMLTRRDP